MTTATTSNAPIRQIIHTAGGIGREFEVGDVVVSPIVRFDCISKFKSQKFAQAHYSSTAAKSSQFATAKSLFKANSAQLPEPLYTEFVSGPTGCSSGATSGAGACFANAVRASKSVKAAAGATRKNERRSICLIDLTEEVREV